MVWSLERSVREGYAVEDITFHTKLKRFIVALFCNVGMACRILLGIEVV